MKLRYGEGRRGEERIRIRNIYLPAPPPLVLVCAPGSTQTIYLDNYCSSRDSGGGRV